jgi:two-component system, NtrC family, response regulator
MAYNWPGNIRELRNVIERGIILSEDDVITTRALPRELTEQSMESGSEEVAFVPLNEVEKNHIRRALDFADGNRSQAAELLGISRKTLYRKIKEFELE